ncbi:hypothetical protein GCM10025857_36310 [Alicyclobacillus contaminans]|uniref:M48 family metallopeptidase n=1 Tax=Alicyclobacillus contaminans TaxID=392016 RepID=UPI0004234571|nr:SprT family zinc-dependent metalloprotease [Alicyclobacillus contaminans]GMA52274.1 hypothetical protein GCM10025857_36310 [Alicyclobacillus contaminans]
MAVPFPERVQIVRSPRRKKTVTLTVERGVVRVLVPADLPEVVLQRILKSREAWIRQQLAKVETVSDRPWHERSYLFHGKAYPCRYHHQPNQRRWTCTLEDGAFHVSGPKASPAESDIHTALFRWYRMMARRDFLQRLERWRTVIGVTYLRVRIGNQRTRWGSCSSQGSIQLNWRLIQAPPTVIDYVVVHELCHRLEMNHSSRFWNHVERTLPDYRVCREWLKRHGQRLHELQV